MDEVLKQLETTYKRNKKHLQRLCSKQFGKTVKYLWKHSQKSCQHEFDKLTRENCSSKERKRGRSKVCTNKEGEDGGKTGRVRNDVKCRVAPVVRIHLLTKQK